ncbi:hypothetical protein [Nonomuraea sp. NPDC049141]
MSYWRPAQVPAVRSYLDSTRKHGLNALDSIRRAFTRHLRTPPIALVD